jgi:hypothetical protein
VGVCEGLKDQKYDKRIDIKPSAGGKIDQTLNRSAVTLKNRSIKLFRIDFEIGFWVLGFRLR